MRFYSYNASMDYVIPISEAQQREVIEQTEHFIQRGAELFRHEFAVIPVAFDLRGRTAGMYKVTGRVKGWVWGKGGSKGSDKANSRQIRYNPWIFAKYYEENLTVTVPHEVAHYLVDCLYGLNRGGLRGVRPHGVEWKAVMDAFGVDSSVTAKFDLVGIPSRQHQQFKYRCDCKIHQIGIRRHNKVLRGEANYLCRHCGDALKQVMETS
jgi:SprT protein